MSSLPSVYEYYSENGISTGLTTTPTEFLLNDKPITLYSGALHYFRVHPSYWRDRLRKLRAANLNCVETYFCWNLHNPEPDVYDFGNGGTDFEPFLNIEEFLKTAQEEDLLVIARPGPYICAEWDFGGLPSWLLRDPEMKVRTSDEKYMQHVERYFAELLQILSRYQFTKNGPIIAFQIENEYGNVKEGDNPVDTKYLEMLKDLYKQNNIVELLFTSDTPSNGNSGSIPDVLYTANFQDDPEKEFRILKEFQPDKPLMAMEYWTGWFDHWTETHHTRSNEAFSDVLTRILRYPASINMYMFHGGTNWGFLNGANLQISTTDNSSYQPDTSSYDYDAPLAENGDYTDKYYSVKTIIQKHSKLKFRTPDVPKLPGRLAYNQIIITEELTLNDILGKLDPIENNNLIPMENLPNPQKYGYIIYRIQNLDILPNSVLRIQGHVCDTIMVLIDGKLVSKIPASIKDISEFGFWRRLNPSLNLGDLQYKNATLDLVVENMGRVNYGKLNQFNQFKGLWQGPAYLNNVELRNWLIYPLEFKTEWTNALNGWKKADFKETGPKLYKGVLNINFDPVDTYIDMRDWVKGIVIVNGFVLSRYFRLGPQQACYLPGPLLKNGTNDILIFEHFKGRNAIKFSSEQIYEQHV